MDLLNTTYPSRFKQGQPGGVVIVSDWQEANQFNPYYFAQVTEADVNTATQAALVTSTDDFKYAPWMATEIPTVANGGVKVPGNNGAGMSVTWTLRDGLKWSDGKDLTCADFKFTADWIVDPANTGLPAGKTGYLSDAYLKSVANLKAGEAAPAPAAKDRIQVDCPGGTTMVWNVPDVYEGYLSLFGTGALPEHYMKDIPIKDALTGAGYKLDEVAKIPVSGPFKFESATAGQELRLTRNDNYKSINHDGPAYLEGVTFKWYKDADAMIAGYQGATPAYDVSKDLNDADLPKLTGLNNVVAINSLTYEFLRPNWSATVCSTNADVQSRGKGCPMSDPGMRQALKFAINKNEINTRLLGGNAALAETNTSPNAWFYVAPAETSKYDPEKAKQILEDAGWKAGADGTREKDGLKAIVELCTTTRQLRQDTLALVNDWLKAVGIQGVVNPVDPADIFASYNESTKDTKCALSRGNFDIAEHAFSVPLDPLSNYPVYHSSQFEPKGSNDAFVNDPTIDAALDKVKANVDFAVVKDAMRQFQETYVAQTVEVPLYFRKEVYLVNPKLMNFTGNPTSTGPLWNIDDWWFQQ